MRTPWCCSYYSFRPRRIEMVSSTVGSEPKIVWKRAANPRARSACVLYPQCQTFDDRGLADAGLADQHRIVLGAAGQHLNGAADFFVASDHGIELAVPRGLRQVARIFLQRIIGVFSRRSVGGAALAQGFDRCVEVLRRDAAVSQDTAGLAVFLERQPQQQPLDGDKTVPPLLRGFFPGIESTPP